MRTKVGLFVCVLLLFCACSTPAYLPSYKEVGQNQYGAYIKIRQLEGGRVKGELLAVGQHELIILCNNNDKRTVKTVLKDNLYDYKILYAKPERYAWTIPVYSLLTLSHGFIAILTLPLNLIVTSAVSISGNDTYNYAYAELSYEQLKMFARFPQGIPPNVNLADIK